MNTAQKRYKGIMMIVGGAALWGISGAVAQQLFTNEGFQPGWLVTVRMMVAGLLLLLWTVVKSGQQEIWHIFRHTKDRVRLFIFAVGGMVGVQYTYFMAVGTGDVATATLLQYLGPIFITVYVAWKCRRLPNRWELSALVLALMGAFLLITNGSLQGLSIPVDAFVWGIVSALAAAFYTVYPVRLLARWNSTIVVGWSMVLGSLFLATFNPLWEVAGQHWSLLSASYVAFVILFGTLVPFYMFIESLRYITSTEASVLSSAEPLAAVIVSFLWLHVAFGLLQGIGGLCIIATVTLLAIKKPMEDSKEIRPVTEAVS